MSTNSTISMKLPDGNYITTFCLFDGYVSHVGTILYLYYNTVEKIEELMKLGYLESLKKNVNDCIQMLDDGFKESKIVDSFQRQFTNNYHFENNQWYLDGEILEYKIEKNIVEKYKKYKRIKKLNTILL